MASSTNRITQHPADLGLHLCQCGEFCPVDGCLSLPYPPVSSPVGQGEYSVPLVSVSARLDRYVAHFHHGMPDGMEYALAVR